MRESEKQDILKFRKFWAWSAIAISVASFFCSLVGWQIVSDALLILVPVTILMLCMENMTNEKQSAIAAHMELVDHLMKANLEIHYIPLRAEVEKSARSLADLK